ncbi:hypothetical protein BHE74_00049100 [Ensete ventricosum]|nr:hypothetical protein BHE74_00049100 [Ensete ventricosum]
MIPSGFEERDATKGRRGEHSPTSSSSPLSGAMGLGPWGRFSSRHRTEGRSRHRWAVPPTNAPFAWRDDGGEGDDDGDGGGGNALCGRTPRDGSETIAASGGPSRGRASNRDVAWTSDGSTREARARGWCLPQLAELHSGGAFVRRSFLDVEEREGRERIR